MDKNVNRFLVGAMLATAVALAAGTAAAQAPAGNKIGYVNTERVMRDSRSAQQMQKGLEAEFQKRDKEIAAGPAPEMERRRSILLEDMNLRRENAVKQFIDKANGAIRRIAEAEKFDIVFLDAAYANARIDITDKVIKALDAGR